MLYCFYKFIRIQRREKMTKAMVYKLLEEFNGTLALKDAKKAGISPVTIESIQVFSPYLVNFLMNCLWRKKNMNAALFHILPR